MVIRGFLIRHSLCRSEWGETTQQAAVAQGFNMDARSVAPTFRPTLRAPILAALRMATLDAVIRTRPLNFVE
jgi:hypothetical protein